DLSDIRVEGLCGPDTRVKSELEWVGLHPPVHGLTKCEILRFVFFRICTIPHSDGCLPSRFESGDAEHAGGSCVQARVEPSHNHPVSSLGKLDFKMEGDFPELRVHSREDFVATRHQLHSANFPCLAITWLPHQKDEVRFSLESGINRTKPIEITGQAEMFSDDPA